MFPCGELGWSPQIAISANGRFNNKKRVSQREFEVYRLMVREGIFNPILESGRLTQKFIVDKYLTLEGDR